MSLVYLPNPYINHDTLIQTFIGEAIYADGILPYGYAFDHKPFLTYFIYGPLGLFEIKLNVFSIFSVVCFVAMGRSAYLLLNKSVPYLLTLFVLSAAAIKTVSYSGNTELVYVPLQILSVAYALRLENPRWNQLISAIFAVAALNVSYMAAAPLLPALLYCIYVSSRSFNEFAAASVRHSLTSAIVIATFLPSLFMSGANLSEYFDMQLQLLLRYESIAPKPPNLFLLMTVGSILSLIIGLSIPGVSLRPDQVKASEAMFIIAVFSLVSFFVTGKFCPHYAFAITAPAALIFLSINLSDTRIKAAVSLCLISAVVLHVFLTVRKAERQKWNENLYSAYSSLAKDVGDHELLSMRASIVLLYFPG